VTRTLAGTTLVALAGAAATGAIYWALLNTPESTGAMLAVSALLVLAAGIVAALTIGVVLLAWSGGGVSRSVFVQALRALPACVPPALLAAVICWMSLRATGHVEAESGEISAWFIARFGWSDVTWLFRAVEWIGWWLRWVVAPFVALVWWRSIVVHGWRPTSTLAREALRPAGVATATVIVLLLVWLPWSRLVPWRPRGLLPGTSELAFVAVKLGVVALLGAIGWSLVARTAATARPSTTSRG
jgi:hypothetical protein